MNAASFHQDMRVVRGFVRFSHAAAVLMCAAALVVLAGWRWGEPRLIAIWPGQAPMTANAAIGLILSGGSLLLGGNPGSWRSHAQPDIVAGRAGDRRGHAGGKEKDFREALKNHDWEQYRGKILLTYCSTDAIIPMWAYMLVTAHAAPYARDVFQGEEEVYYKAAFLRALAGLDASQYDQQRVVIKGCSDKPVPPAAYVELTRKLQPYAQSIMFGEPCSTVPVFKRPRKLEA